MSELAGGQWGVLSRARLRDAGVARATVDSWVRAGRLHVVYRGVYAVGHRACLTAAGYRVVRFAWHTEDITIVRRLKALLHH